MHWATRKREQEQWASMILYHAIVYRVPKSEGKRRVTVTRYGTRSLDLDNLAGGAKCLVDELVKNRLLTDDSPEHCDLVFANGKLKPGERPHTTIVLDDLY